jgi:uncharacterized phage infection (PIP) family protein YhgE
MNCYQGHSIILWFLCTCILSGWVFFIFIFTFIIIYDVFKKVLKKGNKKWKMHFILKDE